jgi:isopropylmalate/homocitrate/citramalate synthase
VANTALAVAEGATVIQTTVNGIGERAGNAPMEETVLALLTMYGVDMGIKTERFFEIAQLVSRLTGVQQPSNRPITGDRLFHVESGIIATWFKNELVGQAYPQVVMGKGSGLDSVAMWLDRNGIEDAATGEIEAILKEVKARSLEKKGLLDNDEFMAIVDGVIPEKAN